MENLIRKISNGKAILFVGAGFSKSAKNINGDNQLPLATELARIIGKLGDFDDEEDLKYAADYFLNVCCKNNPTLADKLINQLKKIFTIKEVKDEHKWIMRIPWKRIYTTNYDDLIEQSARSIGELIETVDIDDSTNVNTNKKVCVHLNGAINKLNNLTINTKFKLSRSSYMSSESFVESGWNYIFKKDLELSSAIVFIGYSLYDIEIEKILYENPKLKNKVYFIQRPIENDEKTSKKEDYIFNKYGNLLRIGTLGFSELIKKNIELIKTAKEEFFTEAFTKYEISYFSENTIREEKIESFLRHGELAQSYIEQGMTTLQNIPFLIKRTKLEQLKDLIQENKIICVNSELGNGKSVFLKEAALELTIEGHIVYILTDFSGNYISDIDKILSNNINAILIIDTYGNYKDLIEYLISVDLNNIKIILSERTINHHSIIKDYNGKLKTKDLNIDILDENEINFLIKILEHTSLWGKYGHLSYHRKKNHIKDTCKSQLSYVLIDVLKSTHIKNEINKLLQKIFEDKETKMIIFTICLLDVMNIPVTLSLISDISSNDIPLSKFSNSSEIRQLFTVKLSEHLVDTKSSIYSLYLLNEHFEANYIIDKCLFILTNLDNKFKNTKSLDLLRNEIRTNLFRFNFIENILPISTKTGMLVKYFEEIKNKLPFHINNPQYWLQYAMAHIAMRDYNKANRYLQNAYDKAKFIDYYDVHKIDNQKARLNLKIASLSTTNILEAMKLFVHADNLLNKHNNDVYKFKVVLDYVDFYNKKKKSFSKANFKTIKIACENKLKDLKKLQKHDDNNFKQEKVYRNCEMQLEYIISDIKGLY